MAPAARTQTAVIDKIEPNCVEYELSHPTKTSLRCINNNVANDDNNNISPALDPYDEVLPRNEMKYMAYVRRWEKRVGFKTPIRWIDAAAIVTFHLLCSIGLPYIMFWCKIYPTWQTVLFSVIMGQIAGFGVTGGAHRYYCHRSFKAYWPLQVILLTCYSAAGQNNMFQWVRDHRVHHKFTEKPADPHDASRGFFFAHVGWLMMKKHPDVLREGAKINMNDIYEDPLVRFHTKYFPVFKTLICFVLPILATVYFWNEPWPVAFFSQGFRYMLSLNATWSVNSFAHLWGSKPYDKNIMPAENKTVSILAMGEGWHNYHHTFPWDYKAAELPYPNNITTNIIDLFAKIGWAYDLKVASPSLVQAVARSKGDGNSLRMHQL